MRTGTAFCRTTVKNTPACSASAGTESTATISKMHSFQQIMRYTRKLCVRQAKSNAKSASRSLYQRQRSSAIVRTVPQSKSGRKPPSASAEIGRRSLRQVTGSNPDERYCFETVMWAWSCRMNAMQGWRRSMNPRRSSCWKRPGRKKSSYPKWSRNRLICVCFCRAARVYRYEISDADDRQRADPAHWGTQFVKEARSKIGEGRH